MKIILSSFFLFFSSILFSQENFKTKMLYTSKVIAVSDLNLYDSSLLNKKIDKLQSIFLESQGFTGIYFIRVRDLDEPKDTIFANKLDQNFLLFSCEYIVAFNIKTQFFYKLKGFRTNDIKDFADDLIRYNRDISYLFFTKKRGKDAQLYIDHKLCQVPGLDLYCLRNAYLNLNKNNLKEFPCLVSCAKRDVFKE